MKLRLDLKIFAFLALFYFTRQIQVYALIMIFAIIHEFGHLILGIILGFKPEKIELKPLGLRVSFKTLNTNKCQMKKIFVALAGPLTNIIMIIIFMNVNLSLNLKNEIIYSNLLIALFNFMPIYPLDGGRILKEILYIFCGNWNSKKYINEISIIFMIFLTAISSIGIYYLKNIAILLIIVYLWALVIKENIKYKKEFNVYNLVKTIENN